MASIPSSNAQKVSPSLVRVLVLLGLSVFINYIDRANLSVAAPLLKNELGLSASQLGILLSAFFWTYAGMQIPIGWLVDRFEVKWVFAIGFFIWSAATASTGVVRTFAALLGRRVSRLSRLLENNCQPFRGAPAWRCQFRHRRRTNVRTCSRHSFRRGPGRAFWLETVLYCSRCGQSVMAASVA